MSVRQGLGEQRAAFGVVAFGSIDRAEGCLPGELCSPQRLGQGQWPELPGDWTVVAVLGRGRALACPAQTAELAPSRAGSCGHLLPAGGNRRFLAVPWALAGVFCPEAARYVVAASSA